MKILLCFLLIFTLFANEKQADQLFANRGESLDDCKQAATILWDMAAKTSGVDYRRLTLKAIEADFFYATQLSDSNKQLDEFKALYTTINNEGEKISPKWNSGQKIANSNLSNFTAELIYFYAVALANYSEIKHYTTALKNWPTIKRSMLNIIRMGEESIQYYGAHRTLGIANLKMPQPFGSLSKATSYLKTSYTKSLKDELTSVYTFNTYNYALVLFETGKNNEACQLLDKLIPLTEQELKAINPAYLPENKLFFDASNELYNHKEC